MPTFDRSVRVCTTLPAVWEFHSTTAGLEALTPDWLKLRIESVTGPDGDPDPDVLDEGSHIEASVRPFGVGRRQQWTSEIVDRENANGTAFFRDVMTDGPFDEWIHTHLFFADGDETVVRDLIEYRLPFGGIGEALAPAAILGFELMFRYRHQRTKALLE